MRQQEICSKGTFQLKPEKCAFPSIAVSAIIFEGIIIATAILIVVKLVLSAHFNPPVFY